MGAIGNTSLYIYLIQEKNYICENLQVYRERERGKEREGGISLDRRKLFGEGMK